MVALFPIERARATPELTRQKWDLIVPIPLHPSKQRQREFNQAERLADRLGAAVGLPVAKRLVRRVLPTRTQVEPARARPDQLAVANLLGLTESDLTLDDQVAATILARLGSAAVQALELRPALAGADDRPRYYSVDWHLNPLGHQLVAAALARALSDQGLWPRG